MNTRPTPSSEQTQKARSSPMVDWVVPSGAVDLVLDELNVKLKRKRRRRLGVAGAWVALLLVAGIAWQQGRSRIENPSVASATLRISSPERQVLEDGSIVELRDGATIQVQYSSGRRAVTLQSGEAHFQVSKDPSRPFVVSANGVEFRAVGTAFSVVLNERQVELLVTEGTVAVDKVKALAVTPATPAVPETLVTAGNRVFVDTDAGANVGVARAVEQVGDESVAARLSWRVPRVEFTRAKLSEVIASFQNHAEVTIELSDSSLADLELSGVLRADNVDSLLQLLETEFQIAALRDGKRIRLVR